MKKLLPALLFVFVGLTTTAVQAQSPAAGPAAGGSSRTMPRIARLYGRVLDASTRKPVEFATVTLLASKKDSIIGGGLVQANGDFNLDKLPFGKYRLKISFIGYKSIEKNIDITPQKAEQDLGDFRLEVDAALLNTVEVQAEKAAVIMNIDRRVYNVDKDLSSRGGTGIDIMKNLPGVTVDAEGNVNLRNGSPTVFIDGRPSVLTLDQIPAEQIERVEIITNPSAKFDASTTGGILNVVLKKNTRPGYLGSVNVGYGFYNRYNGGGNFNVKEGKWGVGLSYNINSRVVPAEGFSERVNLLNDQAVGYFDQTNLNNFGRTFQFGRLNIDYQFNNRSTLTLAQNMTGGNITTDETQNFSSFDANRVVLESGSQLNDQKNFFRNYTTQLLWRQTFPKEGKEWTADLSYNVGRNGTDALFTTNIFDGTGTPLPNQPRLQQNTGGGQTRIATFQFDFVDPLTDRSKLEWGLRSNYRKNTANLEVSIFDYALGAYAPDSFLTNRYRVDDLVNAAYVTYTGKLTDKLSYQGGMRFEQTYLVTELPDRNQTFSYLYPDGLNNIGKALFPSVYLAYKANERNEFQLNMSRKIRRPDFRQITPFIFFADRQNYNIGNPALAPEFINLAEANYSRNFSKGSLLSSVYLRQTQDVITNFVYVLPTDSSVLVSTYTNGNNQVSWGTEHTVKFKPIEPLEITLNGNAFFTDISANTAGQQLANSGWSWNAKIIATYKFPKEYTLQLNSDYEAPRIIPQGRTIPVYSTDLTLSKDYKKVWSFSVAVLDVFNTRRFGNTFVTPFFTQELSRRRDTRFLRLTASVRFGEFDVSLLKKFRRPSGGGGGEMDF